MVYLMLVNTFLVISYGFYYFFLRKETFFQWNRLYLLGGIVLSFLLPLLGLSSFFSVPDTMHIRLPEITVGTAMPIVQASGLATDEPAAPSWVNPALFYLAGCLVALLFFMARLVRLFLLLKKGKYSGSFSFFGLIRIASNTAAIEKMDLHERVHARQWHSVDIMLMQIVKIFNWFNPVVYLYERSMKLQHEYIADEETAADQPIGYAEVLLTTALGTAAPLLVNHFSESSSLKSRIKMLLRTKSNRLKRFRFLLALPLLGLMMMVSLAFSHVVVKGDDRIASSPLHPHVAHLISDGEADRSEVSVSQQALTIAISPTNAQLANINRALLIDEPSRKELAIKVDTIIPPPSRSGDEPSPIAKPRMVELKEGDTIVSKTLFSTVFTSVEVSPEPPGGMKAFREYIGRNFVYPEAAVKNKVNGTVEVSFVVEADGRLTDIKVLRDLAHGTGEEALRVMSTAGKWMPGIQNGRPVRTAYTLPIRLATK